MWSRWETPDLGGAVLRRDSLASLLGVYQRYCGELGVPARDLVARSGRAPVA